MAGSASNVEAGGGVIEAGLPSLRIMDGIDLAARASRSVRPFEEVISRMRQIYITAVV
jgi:hypothetical protein